MNVFSESVNLRVGPLGEQASKVFTFSIKKTCHMINPDKSYHKVDIDKIRIDGLWYLILQNTRPNPITWLFSSLSITPEAIGVT